MSFSYRNQSIDLQSNGFIIENSNTSNLKNTMIIKFNKYVVFGVNLVALTENLLLNLKELKDSVFWRN